MKKTTVIHLMGGFGVGKSTVAMGVGYLLKLATARHGRTIELIMEPAKDLVWTNQRDALKVQVVPLGQQVHAMIPLLGVVDILVCDGPLALSPVYCDPLDEPSITHQVIRMHERFQSVTYLLRRCIPFSPVGRVHTPEHIEYIDTKCYNVTRDLYGLRSPLPGVPDILPRHHVSGLLAPALVVDSTEEAEPTRKATDVIIKDLEMLGVV